MEEKDYMVTFQDLYMRGYELYQNHKQDPANKSLFKEFQLVCREYTALLKKQEIKFDWVYKNHHGLWEYHPHWIDFVNLIDKEIKKAQTTKGKIKYLSSAKSIFIKQSLKRNAFNESIANQCIKEYIDRKIGLLKELQEIEFSNKEKEGELVTGKTGNAIKIQEGLTFEIPVKDYSPKELRNYYKMSDKQFRSFIKDNELEIGKLGKSRRFTPKQVYTILYLLSAPALTNKGNS